MSMLARIGAIADKEFRQLSRDRITFGMVVMLPLLYLLLFGYAINPMVRDIPVGIVDLSGSAAVRYITELVRFTLVVHLVACYNTPAEAGNVIQYNGCLQINAKREQYQDFENQYTSGRITSPCPQS